MGQAAPNRIVRMVEDNDLQTVVSFADLRGKKSENLPDRYYIFVLPLKNLGFSAVVLALSRALGEVYLAGLIIDQ